MFEAARVVHWSWVCRSDSATPPTFSVQSTFAQNLQKTKKRDQNAPQTSRKNPQNARKNPQTPANPENWVFGLCLHIVASSVVVFERHRDKK
jgi:hypothetical protein